MNMKKDIKAILSGEYKQFHRAWLFFLILIAYFFLPYPVSAFSEDMDGIDDSWVVGGTGTYTFPSTGGWNADNANFLVNSLYVAFQRPDSNTPNYRYYSVKFNYTGSGSAYYHFNTNSGDTNYIALWWDGNGIQFGDHGGADVTVSNNVIVGQWYQISATWTSPTSAANIIITAQNGTEIYNQNIVYTLVSYGNYMSFGTTTGGAGSRIDDVIASSLSPSSSNSITWGSDSYYSGDFGYYDYVITDAEWSCTTCSLYQIRANVYKGTTEMESVALSSQTGRIYYQFSSSGVDYGGYTVKLISYFDGYYTLGWSGTELASDNTSLRSIGDSKVFINSSVSSGIPQNITFIYGYNNPVSAANTIAIFWYDGSAWIQENTYYVSTSCGSSCIAGTLYNLQVVFIHDGLYRLDLRGHGHGVVATTQTTAEFIGNVVTTHLETSYIDTDKAIYFPAEDADVSYGVDDTNYTNYKIFLEFYNYSRNTTLNSVFITKQQSREIYYFKLERDFSRDFLVMPGLNKWSLVAYYPNLTKYAELVYKNITISKVNAAGYGLIPNKNEACKGDKIVFDLISPSYFKLYFLEPSGASVVLNFSNSSRYSWSTTRAIGDYFISMHDPSDNIQATTTITIKNCIAGATPTPTTTPGTGIESGQEAAEMLASKIFWAFMIIVGVMMYIATKTKEYIPAGIAGITGLGVFTYMAWVPAWIFFSVVVVVAYLLAKTQVKDEG